MSELKKIAEINCVHAKIDLKLSNTHTQTLIHTRTRTRMQNTKTVYRQSGEHTPIGHGC